MRKIFFLICLLSSLCAMAQKTIFMEKEAGVYKIPCKVNGAKMKILLTNNSHRANQHCLVAVSSYDVS